MNEPQQHGVVIVGSGQGGFAVAAELRKRGYAGPVTMVGEEPGLPYQRPPLSKAYLSERRADRLPFRPAEFFADNDIALMDGVRVDALDRKKQTVRLSNGHELPYDHLVLATGTRLRMPPLDGVNLGGVVGLRTLAHADDVGDRLRAASRVTVIGGGFIGLEIATAARKAGAEVTVVEMADRLMARAVSPPVSSKFLDLHHAMGTRIHLGTTVSRINGDEVATGITLADGLDVPADLVVVGTGVAPNVELADAVGITCENGILVDDDLLTSDPAISAIGDCAAHVHRPSGVRVRLESVQNAADQGRAVAARLMGESAPYDEVPWFWSDQAGAKLQIAGLAPGADEHVVVNGGDSMHVVSFTNDRLVAVEAIDAGAQYMAARRLLSGTVTRADLAAFDFDLRALMKGKRAA